MKKMEEITEKDVAFYTNVRRNNHNYYIDQQDFIIIKNLYKQNKTCFGLTLMLDIENKVYEIKRQQKHYRIIMFSYSEMYKTRDLTFYANQKTLKEFFSFLRNIIQITILI